MKKLNSNLRYWFDNSLSVRGAFAGWVTLAVVVAAGLIALLGFVLRSIPALTVEVGSGDNWFESFWFSLGKMLSLGSATTLADRLMAIVYWFTGLTVMGSIFAFRTVALNRTIERLKAAPSPILERGHTLILGWSPRVFTILKELAIAGESQRRPSVVIFANEDRATMDAEIAARAGDLGKLRVITRQGDTTNPQDLKRANVAGAKSVIVLDSDRSGDSMIVSTVLAARSVAENPELVFVAEVDDPAVAEALDHAAGGQVIPVIPRQVIAKVTAQASRQPGIPAVILEMLDFDGDEIYFAPVDQLEGKTFFQAQQSFNKASVFGVVPAGKKPVLNPSPNLRLSPGDQLVVLAEDDDKVQFTGIPAGLRRPKLASRTRQRARARNMLVIGWSSLGSTVLEELSAFLPAGSSADIVWQPRFAEADVDPSVKFGALKTRFIESKGEFAQLQKMIQRKAYDEVLVLGYRGQEVTEAEADGQTLLATMQLARLFAKELKAGTQPRMVAEILDPLKVELAKTASVDDLVVSENLAALLVSQLSENPQLVSIFNDLFNPTKGAAVHIRPISDYVSLGRPVSYSKLVAAASAHGESAIGWRVRQDDGAARVVAINPAKDDEITPSEGDGLIVIGKSI